MLDDSLRGLPLDERIKRHALRVSRELPAWEILEKYDSDKTIPELKREVYDVQCNIARLETAIRVQQSREFLEARGALESKVRELTKELLSQFANTSHIADTVQVLRLQSLESDILVLMGKVEAICNRGGLNPEPHVSGALRILMRLNDARSNSSPDRGSAGPAINPCAEVATPSRRQATSFPKESKSA